MATLHSYTTFALSNHNADYNDAEMNVCIKVRFYKSSVLTKLTLWRSGTLRFKWRSRALAFSSSHPLFI